MGSVPMKMSPLAPRSWPTLPALKGVRLGAVKAEIKYKDKLDLGAIVFERPASIAGVFTQSKCPSAPVDWCKKHLPKGKAKAVIVNSGNANAFTGKLGVAAVKQSSAAGASVFNCKASDVFLASTGVIGEPLDASGFEDHLARLAGHAGEDEWEVMAKAIMTTDTYHKMSTRTFDIDGQSYHLNGIAKGAGMIAPDMATMLAFLVTDYPVANDLLQKMLKKAIDPSFNSITVDSDTSTSDTVMLFSALDGRKGVSSATDKGVKLLQAALKDVLHELAMLVVCDGEGASKHIEIEVTGAKSSKSAKAIALSIANSPLVKTAIAGEDANWGRIVMAVGKAGEPAERDKLKIQFGDLVVAENGQREKSYSEDEASKIMRNAYIPIRVDIGIGKGRAKVWTCDLTSEYIAINADYRS